MILVFDLTNRESFDNLKNWLEKVENQCEEKVKILLIGNKKDLEEERNVH